MLTIGSVGPGNAGYYQGAVVAGVEDYYAGTPTGHAGAAVVDAEGVLGIRYRHRTSRGLDPQLHDHVLISNAVRTVSDGQWRTIDGRSLYRHGKAAGVEYQTHLRAGLQASLGVEFGEVDANGQADIVGIDDTVLAEFSTRSIDIETELENWVTGFTERVARHPTPAEVGKAHKTVTLATRNAKPADAGLPTLTLRDRWRARADELVDVDRMLAAALAGQPLPAEVSRPAVDEVLAAVESRHAEWAEPQLIEQIAARVNGPDVATIAAVIEEVRAETMASIDVVDLTAPAQPGDQLRASDGRPVQLPPSAVRYATRRHLRRELAIVDWAKSTGDGRHHPVAVDDRTLEAVPCSRTSSPHPVLLTTWRADLRRPTSCRR